MVCAEKPFEAHNQPVFRATAIAGRVVQIFENLVGRTSNKRLDFESKTGNDKKPPASRVLGLGDEVSWG